MKGMIRNMNDKIDKIQVSESSLQKTANAGTLLSGDVQVQIEAHPGLHIKVVSQLGDWMIDNIKHIVSRRLLESDCTECTIHIYDNAAPEWVLQARLTTALRRWKSMNMEVNNV